MPVESTIHDVETKHFARDHIHSAGKGSQGLASYPDRSQNDQIVDYKIVVYVSAYNATEPQFLRSTSAIATFNTSCQRQRRIHRKELVLQTIMVLQFPPLARPLGIKRNGGNARQEEETRES